MEAFIISVLRKLIFFIEPLIIVLSLPYRFLFLLVMLIKLPTCSIASRKIRQELDVYLNTAISKIFSNWSFYEFSRKASFNLIKSLEENELQAIFDACSQNLGKLIYYQASRECLESGGGIWLTDLRLTSLWKVMTIKPEQIECWRVIANYKTEALFEKGRAEIETQIVKEYGRYSISSLNIITNEKLSQRSFKLGIPASLEASSKNLLQPHICIRF